MPPLMRSLLYIVDVVSLMRSLLYALGVVSLMRSLLYTICVVSLITPYGYPLGHRSVPQFDVGLRLVWYILPRICSLGRYYLFHYHCVVLHVGCGSSHGSCGFGWGIPWMWLPPLSDVGALVLGALVFVCGGQLSCWYLRDGMDGVRRCQLAHDCVR